MMNFLSSTENGRSCSSTPLGWARMAVPAVVPSVTSRLPRKVGLLADSRCWAGTSAIRPPPVNGVLPLNHIWARTIRSPSSSPPTQTSTMALCAAR
ncbi:hypothetical protein D9M69_561590 [compost metagenome]